MLNREAWAETATGGILSKQERERTRQELLDHIEDHAEALRAAGLSAEAAEEQAVAAMGDADEVGALLRKTHQPVLTRLLQVCRWTAVFLAAALVLQLAVSLFDHGSFFDRLWCDDPLTLYGYDYFQTETLPEEVLARRVAEAEGSVDLGDYRLTVHKASLDKTAEGTKVALLLEMKADHLWYGRSLLRGTWTFTCGGETDSRTQFNRSYFRRLRRHYHYGLARFEGDLLEEDRLELHFTNGERSFTLPVTLKGGEIHEP